MHFRANHSRRRMGRCENRQGKSSKPRRKRVASRQAAAGGWREVSRLQTDAGDRPLAWAGERGREGPRFPPRAEVGMK